MSITRRSSYARARTKSQATPLSLEPPKQSASSPSLPLATKQDPMSPSSRYLHNLRVIQRHDPTIISLFDQFPHVCVYHHRGDEWQKKGCEGAMFLFEREEEPKYGFYILNRNNTGDYIQRLTPDDNVELANAYLIYRAFGKVTSDTIGLWTMVTQDREAMSEVMMRLHSFIKRGERYPDIHRRKPETWSTTPASTHAKAQFISKPQQPPTQTLPHTPSLSHSQPQFQFPLQSSPYQYHQPAQPSLPAQTDPSSSISAFSNLIAKLDNSHAKAAAPSTSSPYLQTPAPSGARPNSKAPDRIISASVPPQSTGIPLLDSIFASASDANPGTSTPNSTLPSNPLSAFLQNTTPLQPPPTMNGKGHSPSSSSGVTPTQLISDLPRSSSPPRKPMSSLKNGASHVAPLPELNTTKRGVLPFPPELSSRTSYRHGRESAPPGKNHVSQPSLSPLSFGLPTTNGAYHPSAPRRRHSSQYPHSSIPEAREEEDDDEDDEDEGLANTSGSFVDSPLVSTLPPALTPISSSAVATKRKSRKGEGKRVAKTGLSPHNEQQQPYIAQNGRPPPTSSNAKEEAAWSLVDDRSVSVDGSEEGEISGLGDGLMDAIAALSESDAYLSGAKPNGIGARGILSSNGGGISGFGGGFTSSSNLNANGGRGRRKRKPRERGERGDDKPVSSANGIINGTNRSASLLHNLNTNLSSSLPEIARAPSSSSTSSHPALPIPTAEVRNALMQTYGNRRRVGDAILGEKELKAEIVNLINNDATFMKELYQVYLRKVKV